MGMICLWECWDEYHLSVYFGSERAALYRSWLLRLLVAIDDSSRKAIIMNKRLGLPGEKSSLYAVTLFGAFEGLQTGKVARQMAEEPASEMWIR